MRLAGLFFLLPSLAWAGVSAPALDPDAFARKSDIPLLAPVTSVNGKKGDITTATLPGSYTVQDGGANPLPDPTAVAGRYANALDVGGAGPDGSLGYGQLYSTGVCWKRTSPYASPLLLPAATSISIKALAQSPVLKLTGAAYNTAAQINVTNACPGDVFTVMIPSGVFGILGSLGITVNGSSLLGGLGAASWADYVWTGSALVKIRGGTL